MKSIFILSETQRFGRELSANLPEEEFSVFTATTMEVALRSIKDRDPNILVYDFDLYCRMRPKQACNLLSQTLGRRVPIIVIHEPSFGVESQIKPLRPIHTFKKPLRGSYLAEWLIDHPSELIFDEQWDESFAELPKKMGNVLVVEESGGLCEQMAREIPQSSMTFVGARNIQNAVDEIKHNRQCLIVFDLDIPMSHEQ